jgi:transposase-like protein
MPRSVLDEPRFRNEPAAYAYVESIVWPNGRVCPHCGVIDRSGALKGKSTRLGTYKCYACRKPFTVKVRTIFEKSHVPLHIWLQAMHLICSSKKGFSANQFCRVLGVDFKTGWFIGHRIREAMKDDGSAGPLGGEGKIVEVDETYWGRKEGAERVEPWQFDNDLGWNRGGKGTPGRAKVKIPVITLVERGGRARSIQAEDITARTLRRAVFENAKTESRLMTDELRAYRNIGKRFASHDTVRHSEKEYVRGDAHTNTVEGFYSIFKRGMIGIYQHCNERHLHRYAAEFDFRYNTRTALGFDDVQRTEEVIRGIIGKRLTYRTTRSQKAKAPSA